MTGAELQQARQALGLSGRAFAKAFDVSERTMRGWEAGQRGGRVVEVPRLVAILVRRALADPNIRRELGLTDGREIEEGRGAKTAQG